MNDFIEDFERLYDECVEELKKPTGKEVHISQKVPEGQLGLGGSSEECQSTKWLLVLGLPLLSSFIAFFIQVYIHDPVLKYPVVELLLLPSRKHVNLKVKPSYELPADANSINIYNPNIHRWKYPITVTTRGIKNAKRIEVPLGMFEGSNTVVFAHQGGPVSFQNLNLRNVGNYYILDCRDIPHPLDGSSFLAVICTEKGDFFNKPVPLEFHFIKCEGMTGKTFRSIRRMKWIKTISMALLIGLITLIVSIVFSRIFSKGKRLRRTTSSAPR